MVNVSQGSIIVYLSRDQLFTIKDALQSNLNTIGLTPRPLSGDERSQKNQIQALRDGADKALNISEIGGKSKLPEFISIVVPEISEGSMQGSADPSGWCFRLALSEQQMSLIDSALDHKSEKLNRAERDANAIEVKTKVDTLRANMQMVSAQSSRREPQPQTPATLRTGNSVSAASLIVT